MQSLNRIKRLVANQNRAGHRSESTLLRNPVNSINRTRIVRQLSKRAISLPHIRRDLGTNGLNQRILTEDQQQRVLTHRKRSQIHGQRDNLMPSRMLLQRRQGTLKPVKSRMISQLTINSLLNSLQLRHRNKPIHRNYKNEHDDRRQLKRLHRHRHVRLDHLHTRIHFNVKVLDENQLHYQNTQH